MATPRPKKIGKYDIVDDIGGGGMGTVYKATDPSFGRTVAIKVIKGDFADNPELLKRFYREAQAVGNLQHPNIVVAFELGEENGNPYLVMEYVNGIPLDKIIRQRQSVPIVQKLGIIIEVLNALHYAHQRKIVHRDVKPANVMVLKDGHIKLLDFGIAREGDLGQTSTGQMMGTMWYMSPEQLEAQVVDGRSDVFAAGIVLFEVLAYTLPFSTADMTYVVKRLRGDPPPPLSSYLQSYPPELDDIIARALALSREQRYGSAEEFAFDLARVQERLKRDMVSHYVDEARAFIARSDLVNAKNLLSEVLRIDTQNATAKQLLYEIQQTLQKAARGEKVQQLASQATQAISAKQWDQAAALVQEAIKLDSTDPELLNLREQVEQGKSRAQQLKKLLALAKVAQDSGELAMAQKAVNDALELNPDDTDAKVLHASVQRLLVEQEKQRRIQQFLQTARNEIKARQFTAAQENINKAKEIDASYPEIPGLEQMLNAGVEQETRQRELARICSQIEQELLANRPKAARDLAASAIRRYPGESNLVRLKAAADAAVEGEERRAYIEDRIATASRMVDAGDAARALSVLRDAEREYPTDPKLREYLQIVREAAARENAAREKQQLLQQARAAMGVKSFAEAGTILESGLLKYPDDPDIKALLATAREELERLSKKKQVETVSKQAQDLLQARSHTDAIRLLERTAAQISDPELTSLLQYAKQEAAKFRQELRAASEQATHMLAMGQHSEALKFLEAHLATYGKNPDFQVLVEQARKQTADTKQAQEKLRRTLQEARTKLKAGDVEGAEALVRVCRAEALEDLEVQSLSIQIEELKRAEEQRRAEAAEAARRKQEEEERRQKEGAERAFNARQEEERRKREAAERANAQQEEERRKREAAEREAEKKRATEPQVPPGAYSGGVETVVYPERAEGADAGFETRVDQVAQHPAYREAAAGAVGSATEMLAAQAQGVAIAQETVVESPVHEIPKVAEEPKPKKMKVKSVGVAPPLVESAYAPVEEAPARINTVIEPAPVAPEVIPEPVKPVPPVVPPPPSLSKNKWILLGGLALILIAAVIWHFWQTSKPGPQPQPQPISQVVKARITEGPNGAHYQIGDQKGTVGSDGTAGLLIKPGEYELHAEANGYQPYSDRVTVSEGKDIPLHMIPVPTPTPVGTPVGNLIVRANVDHFAVLVDGRPAARSNGNSKEAKVENVTAGPHTVQVQKNEYEVNPKEQKVKVIADKDTKIPAFTLTAKAEVITPSSGTTPKPVTETPPVVSGNPNQPLPPPITTIKSAPVIKSFKAEPPTVDAGRKTTLVWSVQNADKVIIEPGDISKGPNESYEVEVKEGETTYELIAKGPGGTSEPERTKVIGRKTSSVQDQKPAILAARERWRSAYQSLDEARIKEAWPNIPDDQLKNIRKMKDKKLQLQVTYQNCTEPDIAGQTAQMKCTQLTEIVGAPTKPKPFSVSLQFRREGEKWVLNALAH